MREISQFLRRTSLEYEINKIIWVPLQWYFMYLIGCKLTSEHEFKLEGWRRNLFRRRLLKTFKFWFIGSCQVRKLKEKIFYTPVESFKILSVVHTFRVLFSFKVSNQFTFYDTNITSSRMINFRRIAYSMIALHPA